MGGTKAISNHPLPDCNWFFTHDDGGLIDVGYTWGERGQCPAFFEGLVRRNGEQGTAIKSQPVLLADSL
jgi:hypothetical protein